MEQGVYHALWCAGQRIALDEEGFLIDQKDWTPKVASLLAAQDRLVLKDEHWEIIALFRRYHECYGLIPIMRVLVAVIARELGHDRASSRYLYRLFPLGPVRQASRIAGLPKPPSCL